MMSDAPTRDQIERLGQIRSFPQLVTYLRDELDWPISQDDFEDVDDLFYEFTPEELGIDADNAAKIESIKRLRPLNPAQPWGIFFVKFEPRRLPVVALRRLLGAVAKKKRASSNSAERQAWAADDLLFVSNYGEDEERRISFAHFTPGEQTTDLPTLKVLGWDGQDTALHLDQVANTLHRHLIWPEDVNELEAWRKQWRSAFRLHHNEVITTAKNLSVRLASLARDIRDRIATVLAVESKRGPLRQLLEAFQQSLVADLDEKGFADMYAQTIAYGLLSARIVDPKHRTAEDFAAHMRTSPFLRELMESFIALGGRKRGKSGVGIDFDELGVSEVIELLDKANMEAVVADFGRQKQGEDPVIHFYEHFLTEYDKQEKISRGVFYTPKPVVSYIVRSVDELLRSEFGLADGLADTTTWGEMTECHVDLKIPEGTSADQAFVQILDPATGTGTFLVEVIEIVHATMMDKWRNEGIRSEKRLTELWNEYVPQHLLPRLHGYELMMAPYAIAHLKIGLKLYETGYRFESDGRARIYLTNALEPAHDHSGKFEFAVPALANEAEAVNEVKRHQIFTVVTGNPPYSGISSNMAPWINGLLKGQMPDGSVTASYYHIDGQPLGERKLWLQDDYVKFIRLSQHLLTSCGVGIHGYISNHSYLDNPTSRGMRWSLLESFDDIRIIDLHGNLKKKEVAPDGRKDINIFDIQQGVAIGLFVRYPAHQAAADNTAIRHTDLWGARYDKYHWLSNHSVATHDWNSLRIEKPFFVFRPVDLSEAENFDNWSALNTVMPLNVTGIQTSRDHIVIDFDEVALMQRIKEFRDSDITDTALRKKFFQGKRVANYLPGDSREWKLPEARQRLRADKQWDLRCAHVLYRPFDTRSLYYVPWMIHRDRADVMSHMQAGPNIGLTVGRASHVIGPGEWNIVFSTKAITELNCFRRGGNNLFPLYLYPGLGESEGSLFDCWPKGKDGRRPNLSPDFVRAVAEATGLIFISDGRGDLAKQFGPEDVLAYTYAILHSPEYRRRFGPMLKLDFPRVPKLGSAELLGAVAQLGHDLLALHLLESPVLDTPIARYKGSPGPEVEKVSYADKTVWLDKAQTCGFKGLSEEVWSFHIGGYQVCEKWLKDRQAKGGKSPRPGRILTEEDIAHYQKIIVAISETIRIMSEIDEVIDQHGGWPDAFATKKAPSDG